MGLYVLLHREDPRRVIDFEQGDRPSWDYFRFEVPDERQLFASTPQRVDMMAYTTLNLGKYWEVILFMLCISYRNQRSPRSPGIETLHLDDPLFWAIACADVVDYKTKQDFWLRYSTIPQVRQIEDALAPITFDDFRPFADPDAMRRAGVYRSGIYANSSRDEKVITRILSRLKTHYRNAVENGQIMIHEWM